MRQIKFRAWDKSSNCWIDMKTVAIDPDGGHLLSATGDELVWSNHSNYEIMQFTGLTDKNGKEIYEGDILEHWDNRYIVPNFTPLDRMYKAENIKEHQEGSDDWISMSNVDWEVIGNIYENPDLIKNSTI